MAGVEFENLLGLLTASNEIIQSSGKVANGYKAILTNLMTKDLEKQFNQFGLTMRDANDELKDGYTILTELADVYNSLGETWDEDTESMVSLNDEMNKLLQDIAGKHNINTLVAGLSNIDVAISATESAINSAGSASEEYATAMDSIAKKTDAVKGSFQQLVWGDGGLQEFIKTTLDSTNILLGFMNQTDSINSVLTALAITMSMKFLPSIVNGISSVKTLALSFIEAKYSGLSFSDSLKAIGISANATTISISALTLGLTAVFMAFSYVNNKIEEHQEEVRQLATDYSTLSDSQKTLVQSIRNENTTREDLIKTIRSLGGEYDEENDRLRDNNSLRSEALSLAYAEAKEKAKALELEGKSEYLRSIKRQENYGVSTSGGIDTPIGNLFGYDYGYETPTKGLDKLKNDIEETNAKIEEGGVLQSFYVARLSMLEDAYSQLSSEMETDTLYIESYENAQSVLNGTYAEWLDLMGLATEDSEENLDTTIEQISTLEQLSDIIKSLNSQLDNLQSIQTSASNAIEQFNEHGAISIDTYQDLLSYGGEYLTYLFNEQGQLLSIDEAIKKVTIARINDLALQKALEVVETAKANSEQGKSFRELASDIDSTTNSLWNQVIAETSLAELKGNNLSETANIIQNIQKWRDATIDGIKANVDFGSSVEKTTSSITKQTDAIKELSEQYEVSFDYIEKLLDKDIEKMKALKDAEIDRIDATIDSLTKQRNVEESYWDTKISALEKQNDAINDQIELEKLQENLALARSRRVMVLGTSGKFEYGQDESAIAEAESAITDYTRQKQMETELEILETMKEKALLNIDTQISAWEDYKVKMSESYDSQIAQLERYKDEFIDMTNSYEDEQNKLIATQMLGTNFEAQTWKTRLQNLASFVSEYNKLQAQLSSGKSSTATANTSSIKTTTSTSASTNTNRVKKINAYASGISSVPSSRMAIVGDNPSSQELVVGNKLNGAFTKLERGDRVVNSLDTQNLLSGLMSLGSSMGLNGQTSGVNNISNSSASNQIINIHDISLPSVTNAQSFLDELKSLNFSNNMTQYAYNN